MRIVYIVLLIVVVALFIWRLGLMSSVLTHHYEGRQGHPPGKGRRGKTGNDDASADDEHPGDSS